MERSSSLTPRGRGITKYGSEVMCICLRPQCIIHCNVCGFSMIGRLRRLCPLHPNTLYLMDVEQCPKCKTRAFMMTEC